MSYGAISDHRPSKRGPKPHGFPARLGRSRNDPPPQIFLVDWRYIRDKRIKIEMRAKIKGFRSVPGGCFRMKRKELTYRLSELGMSKAQFAALLGMAEVTVYQWEEVPQYALSLLVATEQMRKLEIEVTALRGALARKK